MELDERKITILKAIIKNYMETGEPVGSRTISKYVNSKWSSATIRNEMSDLEEMGYIVQPHTSAGRIPSDKGYRFYVDQILLEKDNEVTEIKEMIIEKLEEQDIGLMLVNISMQDAEPPTEDVIEAFKAVETAKQGKETAINNANKYRNEKLPEASAKADQITQDAEAAKQERVNEGIAQAARFNEMYAEYEKNPLLTKQRMFYETMEEVLPGVKLIIDDGSGELNKTLYLDELQLEDITGGRPAASSEDTDTQEEE